MGTNRVERSAFENGGMDKNEHDHDHHDHYLPDHHTDPLHVVSPDDHEHTTFVKYYRDFLEETFKAFKPRYFSITRIVFSFAFVLIYSLTWCQLSLTETYIITRKIALYLLQVHTGFDCGLETAACTRIFMMETSKGGPKVSHSLPARVAHLLARMTSETVLMLGHFAPQCFVLYWVIGLSPYAGAFFVTMFILLANCICSQSVGRLIGTLSPLSVGDTGHVANATMIMITVYAGFVMFSKPYLQYLNYASFQFYSLMGSYQSEFELGGAVQSFSCAAPNATMFGSCKHEEADGSVDAYDSVSPLIPIPPLYGNCLILLFFPLVANLLTLAAYSFITRPKAYTAHHGEHDEHEHDSRA